MWDHADPQFKACRKHRFLGYPVQHVVTGLRAVYRPELCSLDVLLGRKVGYSDIPDLAVVPQLQQVGHRLLDRVGGSWTVQLVEVDIVGVK